MNRKLVALLVAIMLVASSVPAFADTYEVDGHYYKEINKIVEALNAEIDPVCYNYEIVDGAINLLFYREVYTAKYDKHFSESTGEQILPDANDADAYAKYLGKADEYTYKKIDAAAVVVRSIKEAEALDYVFVKMNDEYVKVNGQYLAKKDGAYVLISLSAEIDANVAGTNVVTTGPDNYDHHYTNYTNNSIIEKVTFCPDKDSFGDGLNFGHNTAKTLFKVTARANATLSIVIKDDEGRLYPITNGSWNAPANAYSVAIAKGETIAVKWFGTDGMGWHKEGKLGSAAEIRLNVIIEAVASQFDIFGVETKIYDGASIRFDYEVQHAAKNHNVAADANNGTASAPKTGDARMAYMTLASLVVMAGVAVIITRKLRTNA